MRYSKGVRGLSGTRNYYNPGGAGGQNPDVDRQYCQGQMSCTKGYCLVTSHPGGSSPQTTKCACLPCNRVIPEIGGVMTCPPGQSRRCHMGMCWCSKLVPGTTSVERATPTMDGLGESFLESFGNLANLAIIGLAIYGGFCLAKKL